MLYRFESDDLGIYGAVERDCPRDDLRRTNKPDGSWLPRVGKQFPGSISYFTAAGLAAYQNSGLSWWHAAVVNQPVAVLVKESLDGIVYEDEWQVIAKESNRHTSQPKPHDPHLWTEPSELTEMVVVYVTRPEVSGTGAECLMMEDALGVGLTLGGALHPGEHPCEGAFRVVAQASGFDCFFSFHKLRTLVLFNDKEQRFERYHYFQTGPEEELPSQFSHGPQPFSWLALNKSQAALSSSPQLGGIQFVR